jgi:secondary thiamine-phosphate synthase enzyme
VVYSKRIQVSTSGKSDLINISGEVEGAVRESGIKEGMALVFTVHTTTGLFLNEAEGGLLDDIEKALNATVPSSGSYKHNRVDNNAPSHIQSILLGASLTLPVEGGGLLLGTWQNVFLAERDGPRRRTVHIKVVGE